MGARLVVLNKNWIACGMIALLLLLTHVSAVRATEADEQCYKVIKQGRELRTAGNLPGALQIFKQAQNIDPSDARPYFWAAICQDEMGNWQGAVDEYEICIARAKQHGVDCAEMRIDLGNTLCKMKFFTQAVFDYRRALQVDPRLTIAHLFLARALIEIGECKQALQELDFCLKAGIHDPTIPLLKALAFKGTADYAQALQQCQQFFQKSDTALRNSPAGEQATILQAQLEQLSRQK